MIHGFTWVRLGFFLFLLFLISGCSKEFVYPEEERSQAEPVRSSDWIAMLPEGETKRQVILGCTPCHQIGPPVAYRKSLEEWREVIARMKKTDDSLELNLIQLDTEELAQWLTANAKMPKHGRYFETAKADIREYPAGAKTGFYHDMTVTAGKAWTADYFGNKLLDRALDHGVNYLDTAYPYHGLSNSEGGNSEVFLGEYLHQRDLHSQVHLATKIPTWLFQEPGDMDRFLDQQ